MTVIIDGDTTPDMIEGAWRAGAIAGKLYPQGVTTGSETGVTDFRALDPIFQRMATLNMTLCLHGETPGVFCLDRERAFLPHAARIIEEFPTLPVVLEHITTEAACQFVADAREGVAATITAHHLVDTLDSVIGDLLDPHRFCKPLPKRPEDRKALRAAATSGLPCFFFGSDSAPHQIQKKEAAHGCAGCFTAPAALGTLAEVFEEENRLTELCDFVATFGAKFYRLPLNEGVLTLNQEPYHVPRLVGGDIVPWRAGEVLRWRVDAPTTGGRPAPTIG